MLFIHMNSHHFFWFVDPFVVWIYHVLEICCVVGQERSSCQVDRQHPFNELPSADFIITSNFREIVGPK